MFTAFDPKLKNTIAFNLRLQEEETAGGDFAAVIAAKVNLVPVLPSDSKLSTSVFACLE